MTWDRLDSWLRWEAEWDMMRRRLPRPTLVGFPGEEATVIVYGPDGTVRPTPQVVRELSEIAAGVTAERMVMTWPVVDDTALSARSRTLRLGLVVAARDVSGDGPAWTTRRLPCRWRGRTVRWSEAVAGPTLEDTLLAAVVSRLTAGEAASPPGLSTPAVADVLEDEHGYLVYIAPGSSTWDALPPADDVTLPGDQPWLRVTRTVHAERA